MPRPTRPPRHRARRRAVAVWSVLLACVAVLAYAGCADADRAEPETKRFSYDGDLLNVRTYGAPAEIVTTPGGAEGGAGEGAGSGGVKVTRWFDKRFGLSGDGPDWDLAGDGTLELRAGCAGFANCEARFRIEVPPGVRVLRDGEPTELRGAPPPGRPGAVDGSSHGITAAPQARNVAPRAQDSGSGQGTRTSLPRV